MRTERLALAGLLGAILLLLAGCQYSLIETPYIRRGEAGKAVFAAVPENLRSVDAEVVYFTDRSVDSSGGSAWGRVSRPMYDPQKATTVTRGPEYGFGRSPGVTYGLATTRLAEGITWEEFVADTTGPTRTRTYIPEVVKIDPIGRFSPMRRELEVADGRLVLGESGWARQAEEQARFCEFIESRAALTDRREAVVFVHGFNNSFDDAVTRLAQVWHFAGRKGIPIVFSWPAGSGGLNAYAYDRESGEFAVPHLKMLLVALANCPSVEKVHVIAHSRGTDVTVTALRELYFELAGATGRGLASRTLLETGSADEPPVRQLLKMQTVVLAAPDLDLEVFAARFFTESMLGATERFVVYASAEDFALAAARILMGSKRRLGNMRPEDLKPADRELLAKLDCFELIDCDVAGTSSHAYVMQHPAALSDLLLLLDEGKRPGAENGRPLGDRGDGYWHLDDSYLKPKDP
jgi:esterase/lipase superfamily enzyme